MHDDSPNHFPRPWRRAIHALDQALKQNAPRDNSELLDVLGRKHLGELWDLAFSPCAPFVGWSAKNSSL